jgi:hypothetical protein
LAVVVKHIPLIRDFANGGYCHEKTIPSCKMPEGIFSLVQGNTNEVGDVSKTSDIKQ